MNLREADERDAAAIAALWTEAYVHAGPEGRREPYALQEYFTVAATAEVSVALDPEKRLIGVVALFAPGVSGSSVASDGEAELARLAVATRARRQGIARALVETSTDRARELGAEAIVLWSQPYQTEAHRLYESIGWHRVPGRDDDGALGRRWIFALDL